MGATEVPVPGSDPRPLAELRRDWATLATAETLHMLRQDALIRTIQILATELLNRTAGEESE